MEIYGLAELNKEATLGNMGAEKSRRFPKLIFRISLHVAWRSPINSGKPRQNGILPTGQSWHSASGYRQGIRLLTAEFFALPDEIKSAFPLRKGTNSGWEYMAQVRPSTGTADRKESYQITLPRMNGLWPSEEQLNDFKPFMLAFEGELGTGNARAILLRIEARFRGGIFHEEARSNHAAISKHPSSITLSCNGRRKARGFQTVALRRTHGF